MNTENHGFINLVFGSAQTDKFNANGFTTLKIDCFNKTLYSLHKKLFIKTLNLK